MCTFVCRRLVRHGPKCSLHLGLTHSSDTKAKRHPAPIPGLPSNHRAPPPLSPQPGPSITTSKARVSLPPTNMALRNEGTKALSQSQPVFTQPLHKVGISVARRHSVPRRRRRFCESMWQRQKFLFWLLELRQMNERANKQNNRASYWNKLTIYECLRVQNGHICC